MILICRACLAGPAAGDSGIMETRSGAGTRAANDTSVVTEEALSRHINTSTAEGGELGNNDHFLCLRRWASLAGEEQRGHRVAATGQETVDRCAV